MKFWLRFAIGAIWGALFGFRLGLHLYTGVLRVSEPDKGFIACIIVSTVTWAFIMATAGDKFWQEFFGRWWLWR